MQCTHCGKEGAKARCARCHTNYYCSRQCQKADYPFHKMRCFADIPCAVVDDGPRGQTLVVSVAVKENTMFLNQQVTEVDYSDIQPADFCKIIGGVNPMKHVMPTQLSGVSLATVNDDVDLGELTDCLRNDNYADFLRACYRTPGNTTLHVFTDDDGNPICAVLKAIRDIEPGEKLVLKYGPASWLGNFAHGIDTQDPVVIWNAQGWHLHGAPPEVAAVLQTIRLDVPLMPEYTCNVLQSEFPDYLDPEKHCVYSKRLDTDLGGSYLGVTQAAVGRRAFDDYQAESIIARLKFVPEGSRHHLVSYIAAECALCCTPDIIERQLVTIFNSV